MEMTDEQKQAYVHSVDIGVGGYNHVVVAQVVDAVLYVEGRTQQGEFVVLIHVDKRHAVGVERLASQ